MKELFERLLKSLGVSGRDWAVLLLALLLAFSIWLIHNLSLRYNDFLTVPVVAQCSIEGHSDISSNQCEVTARCRTTGYGLIRHRMIGQRRARTVSFRPEMMRRQSDEVFYLTASDLMEYSHVIYGDDVTVEYFASDTLYFTFSQVNHKKVAIHPVYSFSYKDQYTSVGDLKIVPDSVVLYGESKILDNIERVYTKPLKKSDLSADLHGEIALEPISKVRYSTEKVNYSLDVTRYVELRAQVSVQTRNVPEDKEMVLLPSKVDVSMRCYFPLDDDPAEDMILYVDYEDFVRTVSGKCPVRHDRLPEGVINYTLEPFYVECIVRDR